MQLGLRAVEPPEPVRLEKHHAAARRRAAGKVARRADVHAPCRRGDCAVFVRLVPVPAQRVAELRAPDGVLRAGPDAVGVCACVQRHGHAPRDRDVLDRSDGRERVGVEHEHRARDGADDVGAVVLRRGKAAERHGVAHAKGRVDTARGDGIGARAAAVVRALERHRAAPARLGAAERAHIRPVPDLVRPDEHRAAELGEHLRPVDERAAVDGRAVKIQRLARAPEQSAVNGEQSVRAAAAGRIGNASKKEAK